jgi:hypothetical protein
MGKGARNRRIRREATEIAVEHGQPSAYKRLARIYRRGVVQHKQRKHAGKPRGPTVWRDPNEPVLVDTDRTDDVAGRRFRDWLPHRKGH